MKLYQFLIFALLSPASFAQLPSFNYIEGGYTSHTFEDGAEFEGYSLRAAIDVGELVYFQTGFSDTTEQQFLPIVDQTEFTVGAGVYFPLSSHTLLYTDINYIEVETAIGPNLLLEDGIVSAIGLRSMISNFSEVYLEASNRSLGITTTEYTIGFRQALSNNLGIYVEYLEDDLDREGFNAGLTLRF